MGLFWIFSQESVRLWYRKIGSILPRPDKICRRVIAVDETVKQSSVSGHFLFIWSAIDVRKKIRGSSIERKLLSQEENWIRFSS
jgi:transposase-like protein